MSKTIKDSKEFKKAYLMKEKRKQKMIPYDKIKKHLKNEDEEI